MTPRCRHQLRATPTHHLTSREWPEPRPSLTHPGGGGGDPPLGGKLREAQKGTLTAAAAQAAAAAAAAAAGHRQRRCRRACPMIGNPSFDVIK